MSERKKSIIPDEVHWSRERMIVMLLISAVLGACFYDAFRPKVPGFEYKSGLIFEACYNKETRVEIAICLDSAWQSAMDAGAWD